MSKETAPLCKCGCGMYVKYHKKTSSYATYVKGHNSFKTKEQKDYTRKKALDKFKSKVGSHKCQCGCENEIILKYYNIHHGIPNYCPGHTFNNKKLSTVHKSNISKGLTGRKHSDETKNKLSKANKNKKHSEETCIKISRAKKGHKYNIIRNLTQETKDKISRAKKGFKHSKKSKEKMRESKIKYVEKTKLNGSPLFPTLGIYEKQLLDILEDYLNYKVVRQKRIIGYFLDGYCSALNLAIEIDEPYHNKQKELDIYREEEIKKELKCNFLRINLR